MEPTEINAGAWYLRALRADDRVDDRPALLTLADDPATGLARRGVTDLDGAGRWVQQATDGWAAGTRCSWAVCEPSTGAMLGEVALFGVDGARATAACWLLVEHQRHGIMTTAIGAVLRLAFADPELGGLGLHRVEWTHAPGNAASAALAARLGFTHEGVARGAAHDRTDQVVLARLATDPPPTRR